MSEPISAVIADDEPAAREALSDLLADEPAVRVVGEATNGKEAIALVRRLRPQLLFLDVVMPDHDGFEVIEMLGADVPPGVVFVTAHDQHAIRAFEVHALDYLLKPFGRPRFHATLALALERLRAHRALTLQRTLRTMTESLRSDYRAIGGLSPAVHEPRENPRWLGVKTGSKTVMVEVNTIDWIEACGDYVRIHAAGRCHLLSESMHRLEQLLDERTFLRTHRSVIVNLKRIRELYRESSGSGAVVLEDGVRLRVARGRWEALEAGLGIKQR
jgi:two-component system LytT family response regulator